MTPSKTYLKFQETRSKEDLDTLNGYLLRLQQISVILNGDTELSNEEENKLYDEDENIHFKSIQDIEDYFEIVHIQTQELTSIGFKTAILDL